MTLTLSPELEQEIATQAALRGITPEDFVISRLSDLRSPGSISAKDRLDAMLAAVSGTAVSVAVDPATTYSRAELYSDHD